MEYQFWIWKKQILLFKTPIINSSWKSWRRLLVTILYWVLLSTPSRCRESVPGPCSPALQPLTAPAVDTLVKSILQARVRSCVSHRLLVDLAAWVSIQEQVWRLGPRTCQAHHAPGPYGVRQIWVWILALPLSCIKSWANHLTILSFNLFIFMCKRNIKKCRKHKYSTK